VVSSTWSVSVAPGRNSWKNSFRKALSASTTWLDRSPLAPPTSVGLPTEEPPPRSNGPINAVLLPSLVPLPSLSWNSIEKGPAGWLISPLVSTLIVKTKFAHAGAARLMTGLRC
jgi:hypothetical protein